MHIRVHICVCERMHMKCIMVQLVIRVQVINIVSLLAWERLCILTLLDRPYLDQCALGLLLGCN